jgi:hypothetical protein
MTPQAARHGRFDEILIEICYKMQRFKLLSFGVEIYRNVKRVIYCKCLSAQFKAMVKILGVDKKKRGAA